MSVPSSKRPSPSTCSPSRTVAAQMDAEVGDEIHQAMTQLDDHLRQHPSSSSTLSKETTKRETFQLEGIDER